MDINASVDLNCGQEDRKMDRLTENRTPISHLAKAGATINKWLRLQRKPLCQYLFVSLFSKKLH